MNLSQNLTLLPAITGHPGQGAKCGALNLFLEPVSRGGIGKRIFKRKK